MKEFKDLTEDQQRLFCDLERAISHEKSVANILKKYELENKDSYAKDIEAVFTAFWDDELDSLAGLNDLGRMSAKYTLSALAIKYNNVEALRQILHAVGKIDGLERLILTEDQYKNSELREEGYSLLNYANLHKIPYEEDFTHVNDFSSSVQDKGEMISEAKKQLGKATKIVGITEKRMKALGIQILAEQQTQATGAGALNANEESNMKEFEDLTQEQRMLFYQLDDVITSGEGVANILANKKNKDIELVLTVFSPSGLTLLSSVVYYRNLKALKDILNVASKIPGLEKKILTEDQFKGYDGKNYTLLRCAELRAQSDCEDPNKKEAAKEIVKIINNMIQIPEEQQNQNAGSDPVISSLKSPSFLSQHKRKVAIIGAVALVGTIVAFMSGYPAIGIIVALAATFMLATEKGRKVCDEVGSRISDMFSQSAQQQEKSARP